MDKIKRSLHITDWNVYNKLDELIKGYNEIKANLKAMSYYNELDRRLKRLEKIEVMRMLDNK